MEMLFRIIIKITKTILQRYIILKVKAFRLGIVGGAIIFLKIFGSIADTVDSSKFRQNQKMKCGSCGHKFDPRVSDHNCLL